MFFRNLTLFRFSSAVALDIADHLNQALEQHPLRPCGPMELSTRGFVPVLGEQGTLETLWNGDCVLFALGSEDKILPASVINKAVSEKIRAIGYDQGRRVGGRERKRIRQEVMDILLPRAFSRPSRIQAYADLKHGWLVIDTASRKAAEGVLNALREALGSFPALPLAPERSPRQVMTGWLQTGEPAPGFALADECELRDPSNANGAVTRSRHQELESDEIREHLRAGKQAFRLGLEFDQVMGFVLGEDLVVRKLGFYDAVTDQLEAMQADDAETELQARFVLMHGTLRPLLQRLEAEFCIPRPVNS